MLTQPNILAAYLYLRMGEQMPEDAPNEWFLQPDPMAELLNLRSGRLYQFIYHTENLLIQLEQLELDPDEPPATQYMSLVYEAAKATFDQDKTQLRTYFAWLYMVVFQRDEGPRWGDFIDVLGVEEFVALVRRRFSELF